MQIALDNGFTSFSACLFARVTAAPGAEPCGTYDRGRSMSMGQLKTDKELSPWR